MRGALEEAGNRSEFGPRPVGYAMSRTGFIAYIVKVWVGQSTL